MPFIKGQSGNPGGKPSEVRQELNALLDRVFTTAKRKKVIEKLIEDAEGGSHEARVLLLAYTYGKPVERREITGADGVPIGVTFVDYRADIAATAAGPDEDSDPPG